MVECLINRMPEETDQFLYGKYYPLFRKLFLYYYTDCLDEVELTNEIYLHIMEPAKGQRLSPLEKFQFKCRLAWWMKLISVHFCISKWKTHRELTFFESAEDLPPTTDCKLSATVGIEREDFETILCLMRNERYRNLIRCRYLEGMSHEEAATEMGEKMSDYYRTHDRAKRMLRETFFKEMKISK